MIVLLLGLVVDWSLKHNEYINWICWIGPEPMYIVNTPMSQSIEILATDVTVLQGHTSEVCACAWSPTGSLLASGSGDCIARIWTIASGISRSGGHGGPLNVQVLRHTKEKTNEKSKDVTTLDWNWEGTLLATGSYDVTLEFGRQMWGGAKNCKSYTQEELDEVQIEVAHYIETLL